MIAQSTLTNTNSTKIATLSLVILASLAVLINLPGCVVGTALGGMAESYRRTGSTTYPAEYARIEGKTFAVVCSASRAIEAEHPGIVARINQRVNDRLIQNANPSYAIPSADLLTVLYNTPQWPAMTREDVANLLGVERLVVIEIVDYRLNEPGNQYVWAGVIAGIVSVYESDSALPNDPLYEKSISVQFPDASGFMRNDIPEAAVTAELSNRFINRAAWLFYEHEESNVIPY
ncbi:MAG: hypothetical protein ACSHX5_02840 [Phycisphaerales bacterium]